ncbi:MAG TPA: hypothetical protein VHB21_16935 [Minicystis sp.]|nr:hypothetical protein [Minicystis sp.]
MIRLGSFARLTGASALLALVACGGRVIVDGNGSGSSSGGSGQGGSHSSTGTNTAMGGSSNVTTGPLVGPGPGPTTTTTDGPSVVSVGPGPGPSASVSTGPQMCGCGEFCNILEQCGAPGNQCHQFCDQVPQDLKQCVCDIGPDCASLMMCFGQGPGQGPGPGPVTGSTMTGMGTGGGGGVSPQCANCANAALGNQCASQGQDCLNNPDCQNLITCDEQCGWDPMCVNSCNAMFPDAQMVVADTLTCAVCNNCQMDCSTSQIYATECVQSGPTAPNMPRPPR